MKPPENVKFWTFLAILILATSIAVMFIDLSIKAAILQESNKLRRVILNGRGEERAANSGGNNDADSDSVLLAFNDARMEAANVPPNGNGKVPPRPPRKPRTKPTAPGNTPPIPPGN